MPINNLNPQSYKKSRIDLRLASALSDCVDVMRKLDKPKEIDSQTYNTALSKAVSTLAAYEKGEHHNAGQHPTAQSYRKPKR